MLFVLLVMILLFSALTFILHADALSTTVFGEFLKFSVAAAHKIDAVS